MNLKALMNYVGFFLCYVEDEDGDLLVGVQLGAKVAVDQFERTVIGLPRDQRVRVADLRQDATKRLPLGLRMSSPISGIGTELAGRDPAKLEDAIFDLHEYVNSIYCRLWGPF